MAARDPAPGGFLATLRPLQVIVAGVFAGFVFVAALVALVLWITAA